MARVPLQTVPGVELEAGSEVQFGATSVDPMKDVVTDDIARSGKAMQQFSKVLGELDDEINDAEAKKLANDYYADVTDIKNRYGTLKGINAVGTIKGEDGDSITVFDQYQSEIQKVLESYQTKASNGTVKYIFENKAQVYTRSALNDMTAHSLTQQRNYNENETVKGVAFTQTAAIDSYESWNDPNGEFVQNWLYGLAQIDDLARIKGWNINPEAVDAKGKKIGISKQYLAEIEKYNMAVMEGVIDNLKKSGNGRQIKDFLAKIESSQLLNPNDPKINQLKKDAIKANIEHKNSICVDKILSNNGNQNDGNFLSQADTLSCLSSNNSHDNGIGGDVTGGLNSNEVDVTNKTDSENIETLDQIRSTSKFFSSESSLNGTLVAQHQPTHLFAIQRLGVEKADSLYTKAKSSIEIDKEKFKNDPEYATEINKQIITNYNKLILEAAEAKYGNKERLKLETQIAELEKAPDVYVPRISGGLGPIPGTKSYELMELDLAKNRKLIALREELDKLEEGDPKYVEKIANDLEIITNGIDYNFNPEEPGIKVDPISGLQPLEVLKAKLKATITDPKELETAIKDLEIKYNKIKTERETVYNGALDKAKDIAFAEEGGWKNLAANNINIEDFTEADQKILKNGPPEESDIETLAELDNNPAEVRDNLLAHRHKISSSQFARLSNYAKELRSENKYIEATGDNTLFKDTLYKNGYEWVYGELKGKNAATFHSIKTAWINRIDYVQTHVENRKLNREEKLKLLNNVLLDEVNVGGFGGRRDISIGEIIDPSKLSKTWVHVNVEQENGKFKKERIFGSDIDPFVQSEIKAFLFRSKQPMSQQRIAEMWVKFGRPKTVSEFKKNVKAATLSLSNK